MKVYELNSFAVDTVRRFGEAPIVCPKDPGKSPSTEKYEKGRHFQYVNTDETLNNFIRFKYTFQNYGLIPPYTPISG